MDTLGDDLVLLAIRQNGVIAPAATLRYGLSGSELVRLAALRRVDIDNGRIVVLDKAPTGDALLDEALVKMHRDWQERIAMVWVAQDRGDLVRRYLERLAAARTIQLERRKALGSPRNPRRPPCRRSASGSAQARLPCCVSSILISPGQSLSKCRSSRVLSASRILRPPARSRAGMPGAALRADQGWMFSRSSSRLG